MSTRPFFQLERREELQRRIVAGSASQEDYRQFACHSFVLGRYEEAIEFYQQALTRPLSDVQRADLSVDLGWVLGEVSRRAEAQTLAQDAVALLSSKVETEEVLLSRGAAYALLASCLSFTDQTSSVSTACLGLEALERVIAESPDSEKVTLACFFAARLDNLLGKPEKAVTLCEKCLQHPLGERERLECLMTLIEALRSQEQFTEAERVLEEVLRYVGTDKQFVEADKRLAQRLALERGLVQRLSNRLADAAKTFKQMLVEIEADPALRNDPSMLGTVWWNLAAVLYETSDYQGAAAAFEKALGFQPQDESTHYKVLLSLGDCYLGAGSDARARDCYEKVIASPYSAEAEKLKARGGVAMVLYESGDYTKAAPIFGAVLSNYRNDDPNYYTIMLWLGNCYEGMGVGTKAQDCYKNVLAAPCALDGDKASAQKALVRLSSSATSKGYH